MRISSIASAGSAARACSTSRTRCGVTSLATSRAPRSWATAPSSAALPPGPAHRSSQRSSRSPSSGATVSVSATSWLASSWTAAVQSRTAGTTPGSPPLSTTAVGVQRPRDPAPRVCSIRSPVRMRPGRATSVTSGGMLSAWSSSPSSAADRPLPTRASRIARVTHSGWLSVTARRATASDPVGSATSPIRSSQFSSESRPTERSTALTNCPLPTPVRSRARPTVSDTAACAGTRMPSSWCAPSRSRSSTAASILSSVRAAQISMIASYRPRRRSVPYASSVAKAASRPEILRSRSMGGSTRFAYESDSSTSRSTSYATFRARSVPRRRSAGAAAVRCPCPVARAAPRSRPRLSRRPASSDPEASPVRPVPVFGGWVWLPALALSLRDSGVVRMVPLSPLL